MKREMMSRNEPEADNFNPQKSILRHEYTSIKSTINLAAKYLSL